MPATSSSRAKRRGTIFIMFTLMLLTLIIPLAGLAIDLTAMYVVQAKLWEAIDGAALEGGRLIGSATSPIQLLTQQACNANFPAGYWGSTGFTCNAVYTAASAANNYTYTIDVTASVTTPTFFMRIFQVPGALVSSAAQATKRPTRIVLVLDRSGSMAGLISTLRNQVASFTKMFTKGFDELGFVTFSTSAIVGYPFKNNGPYTFTPTDIAGGPNTGFYSANGSCCDMVYAVNQLGSGGATNMSDGVSLAYIELQKAHIRDLGIYGFDGMNNTILLFTDGVPNMLTAYVNSPDVMGNTMSNPSSYPVPGVASPGNRLLAYGVANNQTPCWYDVGSRATTQLIGQNPLMGGLGAGSAPSSFNSNLFALTQLASLDTSICAGGSGSSSWSLCWVRNDSIQRLDNVVPATNCRTMGGTGGYNLFTSTSLTDLSSIPPWDLYGNSTSDLDGPTQGHATASASGFPWNVAYSGTSAGSINGGDKNATGRQLNIAAWNAVDQSAFRIRSDTTLNVVFYTIGYRGNGGTDDVLLARVANDPLQNTYGRGDSAEFRPPPQREGKYFAADDPNALAEAFSKIAGMLLNLSR